MVNLTGANRPDLSEAPHVVVIAEISLRPELAPIPPGGEFPDVTDEILSEPIPIDAAAWRHAAGSTDEQKAADGLLQRVVVELPRDLWRRDG